MGALEISDMKDLDIWDETEREETEAKTDASRAG